MYSVLYMRFICYIRHLTTLVLDNHTKNVKAIEFCQKGGFQ